MTEQRLRDTDDERLRALYQRALAARDAAACDDAAREDCASLEAILALVRREGTEEDRLATLDHVMACDACRRELELLRAIESAGTTAAGARPSARVSRIPLPFAWRRVVPLAIAASLLVAVGIGVRDRGGRGGGDVPDVTRGAGAAGLTLVTPEESAEVAPGAPLTFAWRPDPEAGRYVLEVLDSGGSVVITQPTTDTTVTLRDASRLTRGSEYRWLVRSIGDGGSQRTSPVSRLRVRSQ